MDVSRLQQPDTVLLEHIKKHIEVLDGDAASAQQGALVAFAQRAQLPALKVRLQDPTHASRWWQWDGRSQDQDWSGGCNSQESAPASSGRHQPRSGDDRQAMMRNYLSSRKRIMMKDAKEAGQDFDVNGWMLANASWTGYQEARAKLKSDKPSLSREEIVMCSRGLVAGFSSGFRSVNPWYFTSAGATFRDQELQPVQMWMAVLEGGGSGSGTPAATAETALKQEVQESQNAATEEGSSLLAYCDIDAEGQYKCRLCSTGFMDMLYFQAHLMTEAHQGRLKWFLKEKKTAATAQTAETAPASSSSGMAPAAGSKAKTAPKKRVHDEQEPDPKEVKTVKMEEEPGPKDVTVKMEEAKAAATAEVEQPEPQGSSAATAKVEVEVQQVAKTEEQPMEVDDEKVPDQPMEVDTKVAKTEAMEVDTKVEAAAAATAVDAAVEAVEPAATALCMDPGEHIAYFLTNDGVDKVKYRVSGVGARTIVILPGTGRPYIGQPELLLNEYRDKNIRIVEPANVEGGKKGKKWKLNPPTWLATFVHEAGATYVAGFSRGAFWISLLIAGLCDFGAILLDEKEASADQTAATARIPECSQFDPGRLEAALMVGWYKKPSFNECDLEDLAQRIEPPALFVQSTAAGQVSEFFFVMLGEYIFANIDSTQMDECCPLGKVEKTFFRSVQRLNRGRLMAADDLTHGDLELLLALQGKCEWAGRLCWDHLLRTQSVRPSVWRAKCEADGPS
ncbi:unnamed protein product [Symbiodinium sp. CCMP2456]|nr:unnamed protein product [Symbiodinium sp. CCMP2456]